MEDDIFVWKLMNGVRISFERVIPLVVEHAELERISTSAIGF